MLAVLLQAGGKGFDMMQMLLIAAGLGVFYFFFMRPQQQKQKQMDNFRSSLSKGDEVITTAGIYGKILSLDDDHITLEIDRGVKIKILRSAITSAANSDEKQKD